MAKQSIANPVVSLGLDSSGLRTGIASSMGDVKSAGSKIGTALKSAIGTPLSLAGSAAAMAVPLNAALNIASMAANAAKSVLTAPMNALMDREQFQAERSGLPMLLGSDAGYSGVFARLSQTWQDTLADMAVAIDKAFDFRGWIEFVRGMMAGFSAIGQAILGPLQSVQKDPEALTRQFKAGALFTVTTFETIGKVAVNIANVFIDAMNWIRKTYEALFAKNELVAGGGAFTPEQEALIAREMAKMEMNGMGQTREDIIRGLRGVGLLPKPQAAGQDIPRIAQEGIVGIGNAARAAIGAMAFAPPKLAAQDAANLSNKLIPMMERMQTARLGSSITSDSTAIVEAVTRASVAGPGQDLQQRVALAAEETVRQQKATNALQEKILAAYNNAGGDARFKILAVP